MSGPSRSGLDGPKWAVTDDLPRLHSQSRPPVPPGSSVAPLKPPAPELSAACQASLAGSAKRLFDQITSDSDLSLNHPSYYDADTDDADDYDHDDNDDTADTPRHSRAASLLRDDGDATPHPSRAAFFFRDFAPALPPPALVKDICGVVSAVAGAASSALLSRADVSTVSPVGIPASAPVGSPVRQSHSPLTSPSPVLASTSMAARTTLRHSKFLKTERVRIFDGSPSELDGFDNSVKQMLLKNNLPLYYGGTVRDDPEEEYEYVPANSDNSKSNYLLGSRLCAGLTERLEKSALRWWQDYDGNADNPAPNCWRKHSDNPRWIPGSVPAGLVEVSLFDLLNAHFSSDMDAREAEVELERSRWKPFDKDTPMNVTVFRSHVERLLKRAGITAAFPRIRAVRNCLPPKFKDRVGMETTEVRLWEQISTVYVTMEIDFIDQLCTICGKVGHSSDACCSAGARRLAEMPPSSSVITCTHCRRIGHSERTCWAKYGRPATVSNPTPGTAPGPAAPNWRAPAVPVPPPVPAPTTTPRIAPPTAPRDPRQTTLTNFVRLRRHCYRCGKDDHLIRDCPLAVPVSLIDATPAEQDGTSPLYFFNNREKILDEGGDPVPLPLHYALAQSYSERDVFEVDRPAAVTRPTGCLWSLSSTVIGQQLLTVWDTGAVVAVVPRSTIVQTGTEWTATSDIDFVMADGVRHSPLGHAPKFVFRIGSLYFVLRVYIVESANYQLLLGNSFMHEVGAGVFPRWRTVVLTSPVRLSISASTDAIRRNACPPLADEASAAQVAVHRLEDQVTQVRASLPGVPSSDDHIVELPDPTTSDPTRVMFIGSVPLGASAPLLMINPVVHSTYRLGMKDLVHEVEAQTVESVDTSLPILTPAFIMSSIEFAPEVPESIRLAVCQDIIDYSHVFSWNAFDLGCITDIPHQVVRIDPSPAIQPSHPYLYTPFNAAILHARCDPYIAMGIFTPAPPSCIDRTQLTIVRTAKEAKNRNDPQFCRIAHHFRAINDRIQLDPEPVDSVVDMLAWMGDTPTGLFFKTDADRGFYQIVCTEDSVPSTCFELFHRLWVSSRMLFGQKNGPATFKRNAVVMQEELLLQKKTKSYFDDIIGKADHFTELRAIWVRLLQLAGQHGWKFKPAKTKWAFARIETVGFEWSSEGIGIGKKNRDAVCDLTFPRSKTELRGLLGLANQFREHIAGYALLVPTLTALTRGSAKFGKVVPTPEAIVEFENLKVVLASPPMLQQFKYDRSTIVYTDASVGSSGSGSDGSDLPGGLGVVIIQTCPHDGLDYVCAYASSGLTPAQRNYHIVRLELLAFVYACGKFYDWLAGISFVWRSDCRAHEFLHKAKSSSNSTIARYALTLSEFDFRTKWIPGIRMIADSFS